MFGLSKEIQGNTGVISVVGDNNTISTTTNIFVLGTKQGEAFLQESLADGNGGGILANNGFNLLGGETDEVVGEYAHYDILNSEGRPEEIEYVQPPCKGDYCETKCSSCESRGALYERNTFGNWVLGLITSIPIVGYSTYMFTKTDFNLLEEPKVEEDYEDAEIVEATPIRKVAQPIAIEAPMTDRSTSKSPFSAREIEVATMLGVFKKQDEMKKQIEALEREALEREALEEDEVNNSFNDEFQRRLRRA